MHLRLLNCARLIFATAMVPLPLALVAESSRSLAHDELVNSEGLRLSISETDTEPALMIALPGQSSKPPEIRVLFPEHVTAKKKGDTDAERLYLFRPGMQGEKPQWKRSRDSLEYERDFSSGIHMLARATLQEDGVLFHYEFENHSDVDYAMITAVTDPRMTGVFHDVRLERTYVHRKDGFALLAAETPDRLTMPLSRWLPSRYLDSYTWPVPAQRAERRGDGITYYNASQVVDEPLLATVSSDQKWVAASFTNTTGNVWSNPELTCQHVDPERPLPPAAKVQWDVKILIFQGSLDQVLNKVRSQRALLE
jgi:hypothetical protein